MDLPRGTFRAIRKNERLDALLQELEKTQFSGICNISFGNLNGILVFRKGVCILGNIENFFSTRAWVEIGKRGAEMVSVALSDLNEMQIDLAIEYNAKARLTVTHRGERQESPQERGGRDTAPEGGKDNPALFTALDEMNLVAATDSIRKSCRDMVKQLDLEHLLER